VPTALRSADCIAYRPALLSALLSDDSMAHVTEQDFPLITVYGEDFRHELANMHNVITQLGLWAWLKTYEPPRNKGYMFCNDENVYRIFNHEKIVADGHSGATEATCLRYMQIIAKHGMEELKKYQK